MRLMRYEPTRRDKRVGQLSHAWESCFRFGVAQNTYIYSASIQLYKRIHKTKDTEKEAFVGKISRLLLVGVVISAGSARTLACTTGDKLRW
jgi:hypothetical protein